jgi:predicted Zn-dependent protease
MTRRARFLTIPLLTGVIAAGASACATNPATGGLMLSLIGEEQEIAMGQEYSTQVDATMGLYEDPQLEGYVDSIGQALAAVSERPQLPWSFKIVDDPTVNAFALPGGYLYVTRGILTHFNSEAELAAVLGHEIGHVTARHSVEQISRAQLAGLGLGVASILSDEVASLQGVIGTGLGVLFLSYGRDDEHQADMLGVRYALRKTYDPREAVNVHLMLSRQTELRGSSGIPNWLSTHPSSEDRIERIQAHVDTVPPQRLASTIVNRDEFLRLVDGVVYGENPRHGFFQGDLFLHPDLAFRLRFPTDWRTQNLTQAVLAMSPEEDAIVQLTLAGTAGHTAAAREFFSQEGVSGARTSRETINGLPATTGRFQAHTEQGVLEGVVTFLDFDGRTYRILGYTPQGKLGRYERAFRGTARSFDRLTDRAALNVQPMRIDLLSLDRDATIAQLAAPSSSPVPASELALLNGVTEDARLSAGRTVKWVVGEKPPGT